MRKMIFTCDFCNDDKAHEFIHKLHINTIYFNEDEGELPTDGREIDLCDSCRDALNIWIENRVLRNISEQT